MFYRFENILGSNRRPTKLHDTCSTLGVLFGGKLSLPRNIKLHAGGGARRHRISRCSTDVQAPCHSQISLFTFQASRERSNICGGFSLTNFATALALALTLVSLILPTNFAHIATASHTHVDNEYGHAILKLGMPHPMRSAAITSDTMH